ncbi:MAG TPA: signal peptide peptidase SppA [Polyangiaceae bacterium]|nr:signal peptide peptidase SppA [Polyangiaceae bacterium]
MIRIFSTLVRNLFALLFLPLLVLRRKRAAPPGAWLEVEIEGSVVELERWQPFWMRQKRGFSLDTLRRAIEQAAADPRVTGLLVVLKDLKVGSATATSLRALLLEARRSGKRVTVYLPDGAGTRAVYVASAAERVLLGPETFVAPLGFAVESAYVHDALQRLGVVPEVFARGRYKSAGESLVRQTMSDAQREQLGALLDVAWDVLLGALSEGRSVDRERAQHWVENGPWSARDAVEQGLADAQAYRDELSKQLAPELPEGAPLVSMKRYLRRRSPPFRAIRRPPRIAVVEVKGPIVSEHVGMAPVAAEDEVVAALDRARENPRYRGAVICVDSPGGSALASDRMLHALRRLADTKPVVASMGDAAASGGYMIAVGAHAIVAQPTTITGSIGVISARVLLEPLLERLGISVEVVKRGARADMLSPNRQLEAGERAAVERQLEDIYQSFLRAVARGRAREVSEIEPLAGGRVWSGRDAQRHGLVDHLGGFERALELVREKLEPGLGKLEPELVSAAHWRPRRGLLPRFMQHTELLGGTVPAWLGLVFAAGARRERGYLWCGYTETDLGR